ncbi:MULTISPECIES: hypothetical protein [unclassified Mesorhizobium]|uniref:hypothetical protein n=1 Tax=unclassified Mesorhizobium TaxID=325217 RepID=UPI0010922FCD|nr:MULTISPECIES: hypothetical protein [unclassified Mesorhizobium]TGP85402.1 hypothetical protein EN861_34150 [Mesorhizobium sp. M8A.F.Ca.ET.218.01.1.1]TGT14450.1 hypothetical protein EN856_34185 [Mesorhizobium sp. M8A.F.Ca.ET.213.01.1.1]
MKVVDMEFSSKRTFQIWLYATGHSQLILRSNKDKFYRTRVNILFKDVSYISIPVILENISIDVSRDAGQIADDSEQMAGRYIYNVRHMGGIGRILAGSFFVREDDGEFFDRIPFDITAPPGLS